MNLGLGVSFGRMCRAKLYDDRCGKMDLYGYLYMAPGEYEKEQSKKLSGAQEIEHIREAPPQEYFEKPFEYVKVPGHHRFVDQAIQIVVDPWWKRLRDWLVGLFRKKHIHHYGRGSFGSCGLQVPCWDWSEEKQTYEHKVITSESIIKMEDAIPPDRFDT